MAGALTLPGSRTRPQRRLWTAPRRARHSGSHVVTQRRLRSGDSQSVQSERPRLKSRHAHHGLGLLDPGGAGEPVGQLGS